MFELLQSANGGVVAIEVIDPQSRDWIWRFAGVPFCASWEHGLQRVLRRHPLHRCCVPDRVFGKRNLMRRPLFASNVEWYIRKSKDV